MMEQGHEIVAISMYRSTAAEIMNDSLLNSKENERLFWLEISCSGSTASIIFVMLMILTLQ